MTERDKYCETDTTEVYKRVSGDSQLAMIFNKSIKTVDIELAIFHRNEVSMLEPMSQERTYTTNKGYWQTEVTCLSAEDIEFLYKKSKELFGQKESGIYFRDCDCYER